MGASPFRCGIYCRLSRSSVARCVENQRAACGRFIRPRFGDVAVQTTVYTDAARSGAKRRGWRRLTRDAQRHLLDALVVCDPTRLDRSISALSRGIETFRALGIPIYMPDLPDLATAAPAVEPR